MAVKPSRLVQHNDARVESLPAPIGGWNARDSIANMDPTDAVTMINMFPTVSSISMRGGYKKFATGLDGKVQTLMTYNAGNNTKMFAATSTSKI